VKLSKAEFHELRSLPPSAAHGVGNTHYQWRLHGCSKKLNTICRNMLTTKRSHARRGCDRGKRAPTRMRPER
jgi:hypothetical protein